MPRVVVGQYGRADAGGMIQQGIAGAGEALGEGIRAYGEDKRRAREFEAELEIEKTKAEALLEREKNQAAARGEASDAIEAEREAMVKGATDDMQKQVVSAAQQNLHKSLRLPGGALGPFGALDPKKLVSGIKTQMEVQRQMNQNIELAKRMKPAAGRAFLERESAKVKQGVLATGYQEEFEALQMLSDEGKIGPEQVKEYKKLLQQSLAEGKPPGAVMTALKKESEVYVRTQARADGWLRADKAGPEMIESLAQLISKLPSGGVDPVSGKSMRETLMHRLNDARTEWSRTLPGPTGYSKYRTENDAETALAALQKILFEAQIDTDPEAFMAAQSRFAEEARRAQPPAYQVDPNDMEMLRGMQGAASENRTGVIGRGTMKQGVPPQEQAQAAPAQKPAKPARRAGNAKSDQETLEAVVLDGARSALTAGSKQERVAAIQKMREQASKTTGLPVDHPEVHEIVKAALGKVYGNAQ